MFGGAIKGTAVAAIILLSLMVAGGSAWSAYSFLEQETTRQLRQRAITVGRMLAFNVRAGIEFEDIETVQATLDAIRDNPEIALVQILDTRGNPVATYPPLPADSVPVRTGRASGSNLIVEEIPIEGVVSAGRIGTVLIGASAMELKQFRQRSVFVLGVATLIMTLLSASFALFFAGQFFKRKRAELTLGGLANALPGQAFVISRDGHFLNTFGSGETSMLQAAGFKGDPAGRSLTGLLGPAQAGPLLDAIARSVDHREPSRLEFRIGTNHQAKWFEGRLSPLESDGVSPGRVILLTHDITGQRKLADQIAQVQRLDAMGQLVGGIAHDFNNILNVIVSHAELLRIETGASDSRISDVNGILAAAHRGAQVTHRLLAFARKEVVQVQNIDLGEIVRRMQPLLERAVGERITLRISIGVGLAPVTAAVSQIEQALLNLVMNARDAIPDSGVIVVEVANAIRHIPDASATGERKTGGRSKPSVMLAVSDTGAGIPPEIRDRIFEPFFTTKGVGQGTGLGLSSVHGIVKQNGGHIEVYSEAGSGTTFKLYFPAAQGITAEPLGPVNDQSARLPRGRETVLLVEDDAQLRTANTRLLKSLGYTVLEADDGEDALYLAKRFSGPIDIVITDVVMPKVTGPELVIKLKAMRPQTHVLYISGYTDNVVLYHGVQHEGVHFLHKPFAAEALASKIRVILDEPKLVLVKS